MIASVLARVTLLLVGFTQAQSGKFIMSGALDSQYMTSNYTTQPLNWSKPFNIKNSYLAGFSSGGVTTNNILTLHPDSFDAYGMLSGFFNGENRTLEKLENKTIFMYCGSRDYFFKDVYHYYLSTFQQYGADVTEQYIRDFEHVLPSNLPVDKEYHPQTSCATTDFAWPKISAFKNCGYNLAYYMLTAFFQKTNKLLYERELNYNNFGTLRKFYQGEFTTNLTEAKMDEYGYIYIPHICLQDNVTQCESLIFLHGCLQGAGYWGETETRRTGLLEYAAANNIVVVFPQNDDEVQIHGMPDPWKYCWSSMETDDPEYPQIQTILRMKDALLNGAIAVPSDSEQTTLTEKEMDDFLNEKKSKDMYLF